MSDFLYPEIIPLALFLFVLIRLFTRAAWPVCVIFGALGGGALFHFITAAMVLIS